MADFGLRYHEYLNDPIWGEIPITKVEWEIINTYSFRRLQHIKQMGMAYLSFPTANHKRYEHSIGTIYVAAFLFEILSDLIELDKLDIELNPNHLQTIRLAALLHDIGHPPYSHAIEEATSKNKNLISFKFKTNFTGKYQPLREIVNNTSEYSHELFTRQVIETDEEINGILKRYTEKEGNFPIEQIALLSTGKATYNGLEPFNVILHGDFDADRIDYICRDSYYCGFQQRFNISDLRRNLSVELNTDKTRITLFLKRDAIPALTTLLWYRYRLSQNIHLDRTNRIATQMLIYLFNELCEKKFASKKQNVELEKEKLEFLVNIHNEFTDEDFDNLLKEYFDEDRIKQLLKGKTWDEVQTITKKHLMPEERLWLHFFTEKPELVVEAENKFKDEVNIFDCHVDMRLAKAPKLKTLIKEKHDEEPRSIFDNYYTTHGIMIDTFNTVSVYLYHSDYNEFFKRISKIEDKEESEFLYPVKGWRYCLYQAMLKTYKEFSSQNAQNRTINILEFLILYMGIVNDLCLKRLDASPWLQGDGKLQSCIKYVLDRLKNKCNIEPKINWTEGKYSLDVFISFEILCNAGLIDHIHTPIGGPEETFNPWFGARIDRQISNRFGVPYYEKYLNGSWAYSLLHNELTKIFEKSLKKFDEYIEVKKKIASIDRFSSDAKVLINKTFELRNKLNNYGFPPLESGVK